MRTKSNEAFLNRFQSVWARKRRVAFGQVVVSALLLAVVGLGIITLADYWLELHRSVRVVALAAMLVVVAMFAVKALWRTVQRWGRPSTAAEIEAAFPELGQSVRTTVQFGAMQMEEVKREGAAASLVTALAEETHRRALPLTIEDIVPSKALGWIICVLASGIVVFAGATSLDWQWRNATQRAVLWEQPYRQLEVRPGDHTVDEGAELQIHVTLIGRTNREVTLFTRPAGQESVEWTERKLEEDASQVDGHDSERIAANTAIPNEISSRPQAAYVTSLDRLTKSMEYFVTAGEQESPVFQVDIRRPLRIAQARVDLTPPSYTGQSTSTSTDLNLNALQGTRATFAVQFDKPVKSASLVFAPRNHQPDDDVRNEPEIVPLQRSDGLLLERRDATTGPTSMFAELTLNEDRTYSVMAEAADGTHLSNNKYRIRIRADQPPQVSIEEPNDAVEVHTLAELLMRIRLRDDYGLSKAGIIFQINNEQEVPLISQDFETIVSAANEATEAGVVSPTTQAALEKILPLEVFELTQKDSVMYFAFAEDNRPGQPQRTETDMRFIDIRPFKRTYRVIDPDPMNRMMGTGLRSLEELIQRQRFALNRALQIDKHAGTGRNPDAVTLDQLMLFETDLAQSVRDLALGLESRGFTDTELYYQAETAMLAAVDSLSVAKWQNATLQMKDALKALIDQRDRTQLAVLKNLDRAQLAALRAFDRMQAQKLRRPKSDKEEARELIRRLEALMHQEHEIASALADDGENPDGAEHKPEEAQN